jgi:hypothetical protein
LVRPERPADANLVELSLEFRERRLEEQRSVTRGSFQSAGRRVLLTDFDGARDGAAVDG